MGDGIFCAAATTWLPGLGVSKKVANLRLIAADEGGPIHLSFASGLERQNLYAALPCLNREERSTTVGNMRKETKEK
jgi:hypothetical protein